MFIGYKVTKIEFMKSWLRFKKKTVHHILDSIWFEIKQRKRYSTCLYLEAICNP